MSIDTGWSIWDWPDHIAHCQRDQLEKWRATCYDTWINPRNWCDGCYAKHMMPRLHAEACGYFEHYRRRSWE